MPYQQVTRAQLRTRLTQRWDQTPFWTTADANDAINEALRVYNLLTGYWRTTTVEVLSPNDPFVPLDSTMLSGTRVNWQDRPLVKTTIDALDRLEVSWRTQTIASGGGVPTRPTLWAPIALNLFIIWPADTQSRQIVVDGVRATPVLTDDAQYVDIGEEELSTLVGYALHAAALSAGMPTLARTVGGWKGLLEAGQLRNQQLRASTPLRQVREQISTLFPARVASDLPVAAAVDAAASGAGGA